MTITEFLAAKGNHFVALEYYWVMFNRTLLVVLTDDSLVGIKVGGTISVEGGRDVFTRAITHALATKGDLNSPYSYIKNSYVAKYENEDLNSDAILSIDKANFKIAYKDITAVSFDKTKKWGIGNYPHDGKVFVTTKDGTKRELIVLGNQSGETIRRDIAQLAGC